MLWKCYTQYASKFGKLISGHRTGKGQFSFQSQREAMPKNAQTTAQLHSSHTLAKQCSKFSQAMLQKYVNWELPDVQAGFGKGRGTRDQIVNIYWIIQKARGFQKKIYFCFIDYTKAFDYMDHNQLWKILQEMGIPDHLTCLLRNRYAGQEVTELDVEQQMFPNWKSMSKLYIVTLVATVHVVAKSQIPLSDWTTLLTSYFTVLSIFTTLVNTVHIGSSSHCNKKKFLKGIHIERKEIKTISTFKWHVYTENAKNLPKILLDS